MSDATTQAQGRQGAVALRDALDLLPAYTTAREVALRPRDWAPAEGHTPADPVDAVRILAFAGMAEARGMVSCEGNSEDHLRFPEPCVCGQVTYSGQLREWLCDLQRLWAKLPPHRRSVPCLAIGRAARCDVAPRCKDCKGAGAVHHDTPAERWGMVAVAVAVAWECHKGCLCAGYSPAYRCGIRKALDAVERWLAEPTQTSEVSRLINGRARGTSRPDWCWQVLRAAYAWDGAGCRGPRLALLAAAEVIGEARVRKVASAKVIELVLPPQVRREDV